MNSVEEYNKLDLDSRMAKVVYKLRSLRPFYSAVYESLKRVESTSVKTMGVTTNKLIYNPEFVMSLPFEELLFVNLHEIAHVCLLHVVRGQGKDKELWNIACDLYVNGLISQEFGNIRPGMEHGGVKMHEGALFCETLDLDNESVNDIYESLYEQGKENGYNTKSGGDGYTYHFTYTGKKNSGLNKPYEIDIKVHHEYYVTVNGNEMPDDIGSDSRDSSLVESEAKQILNEAKIRHEMTGNSAGFGKGLLEIFVGDILKSHLDWKKLLKKYCRKITQKESSFAKPDKRMYYQRAIYPGQADAGAGQLTNVKVCIDVSGSISDKDIRYFYGQVKDILKIFKLEAELIFWDTEIQGKGNFNNFEELRKIKSKGRGGTQPACLFNYFESKECKEKPSVILVFTDGYFYGDELSIKVWAKKYKDTIWVVTKDGKEDGYPFGKCAKARFEEDSASRN